MRFLLCQPPQEFSKTLRLVQDLSEVFGDVERFACFFMQRSWRQKTISPPAILHATEPLGRFPHSDMPSSSILMTKLTAIVGKAMEEYYANSVAVIKSKTCSGELLLGLMSELT